MRSPALRGGDRIPARFACKEESIWLPLEWGRVPAATRELILVSSVSRLPGDTRNGKARLVSIEMVGGLEPSRRRLRVGRIPKGAYVRQHFTPLCRPRDGESGMVFVLYAMPERQHLKKIYELEPSDLEGLSASALASGSLAAVYGSASDPDK